MKPEATHVLVHAEHGFTANLSLDDFLRRDNMLADTRNGEPIIPNTAGRCGCSCRTCTSGRAPSGCAG